MPVRRTSWRFNPRKFFFHKNPFYATNLKGLNGAQQDTLLKKPIMGNTSWKEFFDLHPKITKEFSGIGIASAVAGLAEDAFFGAHAFAQSRPAATVYSVGTYTTGVFNPIQYSTIAYPVRSAGDAVNVTGPKPSANVNLSGLKATIEYDLEFAEDCLFDQLTPGAASLGQALMGQEMTDFIIPLIKDQSAGVTTTPTGQAGVATGDLAAGAETAVVANQGYKTVQNMIGALAKQKFMPPYVCIMNSADFGNFMVSSTTAGILSPNFDFTIKEGGENGFIGYSPILRTEFWTNDDVGAKTTVYAKRTLALGVSHEVDVIPYVYKGTIQLNGYVRSGAIVVGQAGSKQGPLGVQRAAGALS